MGIYLDFTAELAAQSQARGGMAMDIIAIALKIPML
jgi:hypothetical protein